MTSVIKTRGLTKRFGELTAVADLDLDIERGEVFGFLGPNGSGKTTTIRMLLDILRPSEGTVEVLGGTPSTSSVRARIGFLPADLALDPRYTVREMIDYLGNLRGGFEPPDVAVLLERFGLDPTRTIGDLSTGNRRKVGVTQAFAGRPELLILDEPTSGLDPLLQHEVLSLLEERVAAGTTVFLSSHVLPEVERVAHRVAILRDGRLVSTGPIDELRSRVRQHIDLHVVGTAEPARFRDLPGVVSAEVKGNVLSITVEGSIDPVIKHAAELDVERIVSHETDLEDAFLDLYR